MDMPSTDWATDESLVASLPGAGALIDWFGFRPHFHDATLEGLELSDGNATLSIRTFRMTSEIDAEGFYVLDRHALVRLRLLGVTGLKLEGDAGSIISELMIRRLPATPDRSNWRFCTGPTEGDIEVAFETAVGLYGVIYAKELAFELSPSPAPTTT